MEYEDGLVIGIILLATGSIYALLYHFFPDSIVIGILGFIGFLAVTFIFGKIVELIGTWLGY